MGDITFTTEQSSVIKARNTNLLVSAAAGSGKTAVLVERIIDQLTDRSGPISLDRLLVMTFTRAAAEGMKQKIGAVLEGRITRCQEEIQQLEPGSSAYEETFALLTDLKSQQAMLPRARISTIDSIFQTMIRQYFQYLEIDPAFRVADEAELKLMKGDLIRQLLEEKYEEADPDFIRFSQAFSGTGLDEGISSLILRTYDFVSSQPWPEDFLTRCAEDAAREEAGRVSETGWYAVWMNEVKDRVQGTLGLLERELEKIQQPDGWKPYLEDLTALKEWYRQLELAMKQPAGAAEYERIREMAASFQRKDLSRKGCREGDPEKKASAKRAIEIARDLACELSSKQFLLTAEEMERSARGSAADQQQLIRLVLEFLKRFTQKKRERSIVDFVDMEHLALQLLYTKGEGGYHYSSLADELAQGLDEILIDEYQDSNEVQEQLIRALSAERFGRPDVFMVGDVKQSIYSFRQAKPELFVNKYRSYRSFEKPEGGKGGVTIELNRNFRSRPEVLRCVNAVFSKVMQPRVGGILYDEKAALYPGRNDPSDDAFKTELMIAETKGNNPQNLSGDEMEAVMIAQRILALKDPAKTKTPFRNRDITILVRSKTKAEHMAEILRKFGIEAVFDSTTGYFSSLEITLMLSLLSVINNPRQDIPLAAVLKSIIGGFSDEELAQLRVRCGRKENGRDRSLYELLEVAEMQGAKAAAFMEKLRAWRKLSERLPVHELIDRLYRETGYYHYAAALPDGKKRRRNLDMLLEKAENYAATSYHGLFNFIRYIDQLQSYETDLGEAPGSDGEDEVHITTIHKSKGLEYPVTFIAGMGRLFNMQDTKENMVMDDTLGFACDYIDTDSRIRYPSMKADLIRSRKRLQQAGEELRVLYVAMTRAQEKLIMTASLSEYAKKEEEGILSADDVGSATSQLAFLFKSGAQRGDCLAVKLFPGDTLMLPEENEAGEKQDSDEETEESPDGQKTEAASEEKRTPEGEAPADDRIPEEVLRIRKNLETPYAHEEETKLPPKVSVSELKAEASGQAVYQVEAVQDDLKAQQMERNKTKGAEYGTIVHRAFEILDYTKEGEDALPDIAGADEKTMQSVRRVIRAFRHTELAQHMKEAAEKGQLFREQHFMVGLPACELTPGVSSEELQLMQGIIDAYILSPDGIELIDYKTDRVEEEETLVQRYALQLRLYARALEQLLRRKVKRCVIYSTVLEKEIDV